MGRLVRLAIWLEPGGSPRLAEHEALLFRAALAVQQQDVAEGRTLKALLRSSLLQPDASVLEVYA